MGTWRHPRTHHEQHRQTNSTVGALRASPCDHPPAAALSTGISPDWFETESSAKHSAHLNVGVTVEVAAVTTDTEGQPIDAGYIVEMKAVWAHDGPGHSAGDDVLGANGKPRIRQQELSASKAKASDGSLTVTFKIVPRPHRWKRAFRYAAIGTGGCVGEYSDWTDPVLPADFCPTTEAIPPAPTGISTAYDTDDIPPGRSHGARRGLITGDELTDWDIPGGDTAPDVGSHHARYEYSPNGGTTWHSSGREFRVKADATQDTFTIVAHNLRKDYEYRWYVWHRSRFGTDGPEAGPFPDAGGEKPTDTTPPPPVKNAVMKRGPHLVVVEWELPREPDAPLIHGGSIDIPHPDVRHVLVRVFKNAIWQISPPGYFGTLWKEKRVGVQERVEFTSRDHQVPHVAEVITIDGAGNMSDPVRCTSSKGTGNTPPQQDHSVTPKKPATRRGTNAPAADPDEDGADVTQTTSEPDVDWSGAVEDRIEIGGSTGQVATAPTSASNRIELAAVAGDQDRERFIAGGGATYLVSMAGFIQVNSGYFRWSDTHDSRLQQDGSILLEELSAAPAAASGIGPVLYGSQNSTGAEVLRFRKQNGTVREVVDQAPS